MALVIVTDCALVKVPPVGEYAIVATFISYVAAAVLLAGVPVLNALALSVCEELTVMLLPEVMLVSDSVGSLPFCVYRMVAPEVVAAIVTVRLVV